MQTFWLITPQREARAAAGGSNNQQTEMSINKLKSQSRSPKRAPVKFKNIKSKYWDDTILW